MGYDLKITGGTIVDGTGTPGFAGDVGIRDGKVVAFGTAPDDAAQVITRMVKSSVPDLSISIPITTPRSFGIGI